MRRGWCCAAALAVSLTPGTRAQWTGWESKQAAADICSWGFSRAHVLRDAVYLDGGQQWWTRTMQTGESEPWQEDGGGSWIYTLNFTQTLDLSDKANTTAYFQAIEKAGGAGNNLTPNFVAGGILGNDAQLFLYGGAATATQAWKDTGPRDVLEYQRYKYGGENSVRPGFVADELPKDMNIYLAYGASISAPSENKAWYFSGLKSNSSGIIYVDKYPGEFASDISETMIQLEFDDQSQNLETWSNLTLSESVPGRASAEGVFVPVGENGVLVFVAGVTHAEFATKKQVSDDEAVLKSDSEGFMKTIDVYDIASGRWYKQSTLSAETVPGRAHGCAVMSYAKDMSSFNIYYYGGYPAANVREGFSDDVWILSLPSFIWVKAKSGTADHARIGHRCVTPYPDQMLVLGGIAAPEGNGPPPCLQGGVVQLLNLTSLEWMTKYDPEVYGEYGVPEAVQKKIGGGYVGGATKTDPPGGWDDVDLQAIFGKAYPTERIHRYYPYQATKSTDRPDVDGHDSGGGGGLPKWVAPTLGVILGLVFITALVVIFLLWRRRRIIKRGAYSTASSDESGNRIVSWMRGQPAPSKAMTVTTTEDPTLAMDITERSTPAIGIGRYETPDHVTRHAEMDSSSQMIHEMPDNSPTAELHSTHLTPDQIVSRKFSGPSPFSSAEGGPGTEHSSLSRASANASASVGRSPILRDADGPSTPITPNPAESSRVTSGVSGISEREVRHLRQISEATVSDASEHHHPVEKVLTEETEKLGKEREREGDEVVITPDDQSLTVRSAPEIPTPLSAGISPPSAEGASGEDYLTAKSLPVSPGGGTLSPTRRSLFRESAEDMGDRRR